jgi:toxin ParE1/3/4
VQLKWTDLALADLGHIETYIAEDNSPVVAIDVVLKVIDTTEMILPDHPGAGRAGRVKGTRELVIDGIPFIVIYRKVERLNQVQILRVLHDAQQWPKPVS